MKHFRTRSKWNLTGDLLPTGITRVPILTIYWAILEHKYQIIYYKLLKRNLNQLPWCKFGNLKLPSAHLAQCNVAVPCQYRVCTVSVMIDIWHTVVYTIFPRTSSSANYNEYKLEWKQWISCKCPSSYRTPPAICFCPDWHVHLRKKTFKVQSKQTFAALVWLGEHCSKF